MALHTKTATGYPVHVSTDNSKTGIWSFNLLAGANTHKYDGLRPRSCAETALPGTCSQDCPGCYAKNMTRYAGCYNNYCDNTAAALNDPAGTVRAVEQLIFGGILVPSVFRWHDSGDFPSIEYFAEVCECARRHPNTSFGAYTKRADIVLAYGVDNIPENLSLQCSPWRGCCDPIADLPQFCFDDGSDISLRDLPHCPAVDCHGSRTGIRCCDCLHCYHAKRGQRWAVYAH